MLIPVICGCSSDTSRCVAEKKYTEQQAKKLFPQVFVPVCNPDGTYSEVTENTMIFAVPARKKPPASSHFAVNVLSSCMDFVVGEFLNIVLLKCFCVLTLGSVPQLHWILLVCHPQWPTHQRLSGGQ